MKRSFQLYTPSLKDLVSIQNRMRLETRQATFTLPLALKRACNPGVKSRKIPMNQDFTTGANMSAAYVSRTAGKSRQRLTLGHRSGMRIIGEKDYGEHGVWETVDDNGFIYKRRKRLNLNSEKPSSQKDLEVGYQDSPREPESSQEHFDSKKLEFCLQQSEEEQRCRAQFVRKVTMALLEEHKRKYMSEVESWQEILRERESENVPYTGQVAEVDDFPSHASEDALDESILELQVQVKIFEGLVKELKKQHDNADEIRQKLEEKIKDENSIRDKCLKDEVALLINNSPRSLLGSLYRGASPLVKAHSFSTEVGRLMLRTPKSGEPSVLSPHVFRLPRLSPGVSRLRRQSLLSPGITESQGK